MYSHLYVYIRIYIYTYIYMYDEFKEKLERATGSAAVSSGCLLDVFQFLLGLWENGIE